MKIFIYLSLLFSLAYSSSLNHIAIKVNEDIITAYDIQTTMKINKLSKKQATEFLINKLIRKEAIRQVIDDISSDDLKTQIDKIAMSLNISSLELKQRVLRQMSWNTYITNLKEQIKNSTFEQSVLASDAQSKDDSFFREFYAKNSDKFMTYKSIKVIIYTSSNQALLHQTTTNPMFYDASIKQSKETLKQDTFKDKNTYKFLSNMKNKTFSPMINNGGTFMSYFVLSKNGSVAEPYEKAIPYVKNLYIVENKDKTIKAHLKQIRTNSKIVYIKQKK